MWMTDFAFASTLLGSAADAADSSWRKSPSVRPSALRQPTRIRSRRVGLAKWEGSAVQVPGCGVISFLVFGFWCLLLTLALTLSLLRVSELDDELGPLLHVLELGRVEVPPVAAGV